MGNFRRHFEFFPWSQVSLKEGFFGGRGGGGRAAVQGLEREKGEEGRGCGHKGALATTTATATRTSKNQQV